MDEKKGEMIIITITFLLLDKEDKIWRKQRFYYNSVDNYLNLQI